MRKLLAIWITKLLILAGKLAGKKGSSTPGSAALRICPDILKLLAAQVRNEIVVVCGTNGKTTTNNLIASILKANGYKVVCNYVGANMLPGVVTAFISRAGWLGRLDADFACIEVDEISTVRVFRHFQPAYMVVTNLFRDQLDRYGEIDITLRYLKDALKLCGGTRLILNGDDPLLAAFGRQTGKQCVYFGVGQDVGIALNETKEGRFCLFCGAELHYDYYHYSQLGRYRCDSCGFARPAVEYEAQNVQLEHGIAFDVKGKHFAVKYRGFYNIYNILAAYAAVDLLGARAENLNAVFAAYKPQIGRMEEFTIGGKQVVFNLSKNPAGFNQAISTVLGDKRPKDVLVVINDNAQDGRDISWIWDVDFERLADAKVQTLYAGGIRHHDVGVRFKYAELAFSDAPDVRAAVAKGIAAPGEVLYVLVNYTALFSTQDILKDMEDRK